MEKKDIQFTKEMFEFAPTEGRLHDQKLDTKALSYLQDAWKRFKKNKSSVVATVIIALLIVFALVGPIISPYTVEYSDSEFSYTLPKSKICSALGWDFWDGCSEKSLSEYEFIKYFGMSVEAGDAHAVVKDLEYQIVNSYDYDANGNVTQTYTSYVFRFDSYQQKGMVYKNLSEEEYAAVQAYQDETGIQVIYPITVRSLRPLSQDANDANYWYKTQRVKGKTEPVLDTTKENLADQYINIYIPYSGTRAVVDEATGVTTQVPWDGYTSTVVIEELDESGNRLYDYGIKNQTGYQVRVNYIEYYVYEHTMILKDGISEPYFLFGTTSFGQDIFTCLAAGARFSFMLAIIVASVNLFVGAIYGAIEGYYGGIADLAMERFSDVLASVPFMIVITLLKLHMKASSDVIILFISFFLTGWIGMASRVRMQFYRFKGSEYVLASRTLGASDARLMFKHIFPNSLGTIITGSVLVIPGVIFSESSLSYLGIINLNTGSITSVGTLLANAQPYLETYPFMILFPAIFISLLMLCFNLFGNGLRDAFNPSLRGAED